MKQHVNLLCIEHFIDLLKNGSLKVKYSQMELYERFESKFISRALKVPNLVMMHLVFQPLSNSSMVEVFFVS